VFPRDLHDFVVGKWKEAQAERERERHGRHQHDMSRQHPAAGPQCGGLDTQVVAERMRQTAVEQSRHYQHERRHRQVRAEHDWRD
jgi:hypothetical protein